MRKLNITEQEAGQRLDKYLAKYMRKAPKSFFYKMLRKKNIVLNGKKAEPGTLLSAGDELTLWLSEETIDGFREAMPQTFSNIGAQGKKTAEGHPGGRGGRTGGFQIVYEDSRLIIANKEAGLLSQKSRPEDLSLNELLLMHTLRESGEGNSENREALLHGFRPSVCNRLDRNTSGLVVFAKTYPAARALSALFADRSLHKYYLAAIRGRLSADGPQCAYLKKDEKTNRVQVSERPFPGADRIETSYETLRANGEYSILRILLVTGKTHQIRAHLSYLGHPVLGDPKYGDRAQNARLMRAFGISRQLLHAAELSFPDGLPEPLSDLSGQSFSAALPEDFRKLYASV